MFLKAKILVALLVAAPLGATATPTNMKESAYLPSCRSKCQSDVATAGITGLEGIRKCDCYCKSSWQKLVNEDVDDYVKRGTFSASVEKRRRAAFDACFQR